MNVLHPPIEALLPANEPRDETVRLHAVPPPEPATPLDRAWLLRHSIVGFEDTDPRARPFVLLRSELLTRCLSEHRRVIAITSTHPGDGKTTVIANLGAAISRIHPVILIDLDLRRPNLAERFGITVDRGVDDYLDGTSPPPWTSYAVDDGAQLTILPVRERRTASARLLSSDRLDQLFATIRARADRAVCLVDTPPVLALDDIMVIGRAVDGVLLVVNEGRTRREELREAIRMLHPTPVIGTVLNRSITASYGRSAGTYYDQD